MKIRFLPESTINRIAAGEVIERPASVIKELVENAIDAGATNVEVTIEQAGKNLIVITDNGFGLAKEDLEIAIEKNTTSKLVDDNDLLNINSFGFRGEALSSIGAVSRMFITSKQADAEKGYSIQLIGGKEKLMSPAIYSTGTKVEIRDLFFATPARLKFLRSDKTEYLACVNIIKKIALAHPNIGFSLTSDGREVINYKKHEDNIAGLKKRIAEIMGNEFEQNSMTIDYAREELVITGATSLPTYHRASSDDQYLFVNNRPVKDKILISSLRVAYQDFIAKDRYPLAVIFLQVPPRLVDVNVHPSKSEVRFHDPSLIRGSLINAIKESIKLFGNKVSDNYASGIISTLQYKIDQDASARYADQNATGNAFSSSLEQDASTRSGGGAYSSVGGGAYSRDNAFSSSLPKPNIFGTNQFNDRSSSDFKLQNTAQSQTPSANYQQYYQPLISTQPVAQIIEASNQDLALERGEYPLGAAKAQFHKTYIISQTQDSVIIVDQHAAHERLGYEQIKQSLANSGLMTQRLLFPEIIELPDEQRAYCLATNKEQLKQLGLTFEVFGTNSIVVTEIPSLISDTNIKQLINDLADNLLDAGESLALTKLIEHVTETYACHYSVRAGKTLDVGEMNELLRQMENVPFSGQCNHGRPTYVELKLKDIEKLFGRK